MQRAFAVPYQRLHNWAAIDPGDDTWHWPEASIRTLAEAIEPQREPLDRSSEVLPLLSIHFDGCLDLRDVSSNDISGSLFRVSAGDVVYSKIDVRNGAIGVVPSDIASACVTSEYPVYRIKPGHNPAYITVLLRTRRFRRIVRAISTGASGRKRVLPETLLQVPVPIPEKAIQDRIAEAWSEVQDRITSADCAFEQLRARVDDFVRKEYAANARWNALGPRALAVPYNHFASWDVKGTRARLYRESVPQWKALSEFLEEATELARPADQPHHLWPVYGVNNRTGVFFNERVPGAKIKTPYKRIKKGWFFHNPTRAIVGSLGLVPEVPEDAITSPEYQVWRVRQGLDKGFLDVLIGTSFFQQLINCHRVGAVKQRLYSNNLFEIRIPVFSDEFQQDIALSRSRILEQIAAARAELDARLSRIEEVITGIVPLSALRQ